jgi:predicted nucleic acid-binding protein
MKSLDALVDTNILIDLLDERIPFNTAATAIFTACAEKKINGYIAAHSIPDIFYILRKDYSAADRKQMLLGLFKVVDVVGIDKPKLVTALTSEDFDDIEDCLQIECAKAAGVDFIITRDISDFAPSPIPAVLPEDFLKLIGQ